jgi:hypothetical protein
MSQFGYEPLRTSKSRISLENPKEKSLHPAVIFILVFAAVTAGAYFSIRLLHNAAVNPINQVGQDMSSRPDTP